MKLKIDEKVALGIIDLQNDFLPGGALAVVGGDEIIDPIRETAKKKFPANQTFATADAHPKDHGGFKIWPEHCVRGTEGADLHPLIAAIPKLFEWLKAGYKDVDSYGGFKDAHGKKSGLAEQLLWRGFKVLVLCGLAFDFCVGETAVQGVEEGFEVYILEDCTRAVFPDKYEEKKAELIEAGVKFINSEDLEAA